LAFLGHQRGVVRTQSHPADHVRQDVVAREYTYRDGREKVFGL